MTTVLPFVGRSAEQRELLAHIDAAAAGRGGLILVGGEAGAGKTALLRAVLTVADAALTVTGRCPGPDETPPFGPWMEAVQKLHRDQGWETDLLPPPFGAALGRLSAYDLAGALSHWFGHRGPPLVLVIEDLHWADAASLDLLRHMAPQLGDWPVLVISTYRTDELSRNHPLWHLLPEVQRAGATRILLDRLDRTDVAELVTRSLPPGPSNTDAMASLVYDRTAGLALFVREMVDLVARTGHVPEPADPLPQTLQQAIDSKLDRLPPVALSALEPAALIGERFSFDLLAQVAEMAEEDLSEALEAAIARHVIRPVDTAGSWLAFDHALFRESLLARLLGSRRRRWHARIAAAMAAGPEGDLDAIAYHLTRAADPRAAVHLIAAGDRARTLGALAQARDRYEQALSLLPAAHPDRPETLLKLAFCLQGDPARAVAVAEEAKVAADAAGDEAVSLWARHIMVTHARRANDHSFVEQATALMAAQEELLTDPRYQRLETELFGGLAGYPQAATSLVSALALSGKPDRARALLQDISVRALPGAGANILKNNMVLALLEGRLVGAADLCSHATEVALRLRQFREAVTLRNNEMMIRLIGPADQPEALDRVAERLRDLEEEAWQRTGYANIKRGFSLTGVYQYFRGDWRGAYRNVVEAVGQDPSAYGGTLVWYAGRILLKSGAPEEALPFAEAVPPLRPADPVPINSNFMVLGLVLRAEVYVALGDPERARPWLEAAERWPALGIAPFYRASVRLAWAAYHRLAGDLDSAWRAATEALADARAASSSFTAIEAHRQLGELAAARGDADTAAQHFEDALSVAERCRFPFEAALVRLARGRTMGATPQAVADLEAVCAYFDEVGATPALVMARRALDQAATKLAPQREPAASSLRDGLTEREGEVIALVCEGLTDREIAARLFISRKTVDRHLRNIFNKTGVSNRAALAAYATRHGLLG